MRLSWDCENRKFVYGYQNLRHEPNEFVQIIIPCPNKIVLHLRNSPNKFVPFTAGFIALTSDRLMWTILSDYCLRVEKSRLSKLHGKMAYSTPLT